MEKDNLPCTEISERDSACCESKTLKIFDKFQALYEDQLSEIDESSVDSLQVKKYNLHLCLNIIISYVCSNLGPSRFSA